MKPDQMFAHWKQVRKDLVAMMDQFSQEELSYMPFEGSWTVGRIMLHIADAEDGWFRYAVTQELESWPEQYILENFPGKEYIQQALSTVHTRTEQYLAGLEENQLNENLRLAGVVNATQIAVEEIGWDVPNTCLLGAFAATTGWVNLKSILSILAEYFSGDVLERNIRSAQRGFNEVRKSKW